MLPKFVASFPEVRVILTIDNRVVDLLTEEFDVAIRIGPLADSDLIARRLTTMDLWLCASPAYLRRHPRISVPGDIAQHTIVGHRERTETWLFKVPGGKSQGIEVRATTVVPEPDVVRTMLLAGAGIGRLPDFHAAEDIASRRLVRVLNKYETQTVDVHAMYPSHRSLSAKVRVFIDALVAGLAAA